MTEAATYDVIVLGAGAAGLMCAIEAGKRGRSVLVLESNGEPGRKILISGGGRCNFTNVYAAPEHYLSSNPDFCRSALARYTPDDFIELVERHGIPYHEKKLGQLFCDGSARAIVDMLLSECSSAGVEVRSGCSVNVVCPVSAGFEVRSNVGTFIGASLVVATGGISIPKMGATDLGYRLARQFGLSVVETHPGLVPLTFDTANQSFFANLSGISIDAVVTCAGRSFRENILFTHRGLSGPALLQASSFWSPGTALSLDLLPDADDIFDDLGVMPDDGREFATVLSEHLPRRFAHAWCNRYAPSKPLNRYSLRDREELSSDLHNWQVLPAGTEGFAKAEVTVGGVDTRELSSRTMAARDIPGLYFIGEVVDVTGWLGGYNFQWAWASGFAAGQSA